MTSGVYERTPEWFAKRKHNYNSNKGNNTRPNKLGFSKDAALPFDFATTKRDNHLWNFYKIRERDFQALLKSQGGGCAICGVKDNGDEKRELCVDHVHGSDPIDIRGILCLKCNAGIGHLQEDEKIMSNAIKYVKGDRYVV
jgi:hypothetical protein